MAAWDRTPVRAVGPVELSVQDPGSDFAIEFPPVTVQEEPRCLDHEGLVWEEEGRLLTHDLAPSDRRDFGWVSLRWDGGGSGFVNRPGQGRRRTDRGGSRGTPHPGRHLPPAGTDP